MEALKFALLEYSVRLAAEGGGGAGQADGQAAERGCYLICRDGKGWQVVEWRDGHCAFHPFLSSLGWGYDANGYLFFYAYTRSVVTEGGKVVNVGIFRRRVLNYPIFFVFPFLSSMNWLATWMGMIQTHVSRFQNSVPTHSDPVDARRPVRNCRTADKLQIHRNMAFAGLLCCRQ